MRIDEHLKGGCGLLGANRDDDDDGKLLKS
jgi:hypothetical protein